MVYREHGLSIAAKEKTLGASLLDALMPGKRAFARLDNLSAPDRLIDDIFSLVKHVKISDIAKLLGKSTLKPIHTELAGAFRDKVDILVRDAVLTEAAGHEVYLSESAINKATAKAVKEPLKLARELIESDNLNVTAKPILQGVIDRYKAFV